MTDNHLSDPLTEREQEILACLVEGLSNREIAARLFLSYQTVKWYNTQIYSKLGVNNRDLAIERALALGIHNKTSDAFQQNGKHNLPQSTTEFVGREDEINELQDLLAGKRLLTILAPGGMGKTRLALEVAHRQIGQHANGVFFVPLAPLSSANDIVTTIAENIDFVFHGESPPPQQLITFLKDREMLLVLDNFEHLMDGAGLVSDIIKASTDITILVTLRERLNLQGENVYDLRGLVFPTWETPEDALEYDAVKLFMQSARRVRREFGLHPDQLDFLARICRLTAGMPLGIELAAGWVDVLSLEQIATEIQQGIDILETEMRDIPERHRSLRATFERTWQRLTDEQQQIFAKLSVFRGGFTLQSAKAVAGATIRHLRKLSQKTLIQTETNERYSIHELLRQFGEDKLSQADDLFERQARHAAYFTDFMAERELDFNKQLDLYALEQIDNEFENIRVAWLHIVKHRQWKMLLSYFSGLLFYGDNCVRPHEMIELLEYAKDTLQSDPLSELADFCLGYAQLSLSWFYGYIRLNRGDALKEAFEILQRHNNPKTLALAYFMKAVETRDLMQHENTIRYAEMGEELLLLINDVQLSVQFSWLKAEARLSLGKLDQATQELLEVVPIVGNNMMEIILYRTLGMAYLQLKQYEEAKHWLQKAVSTREQYTIISHAYSVSNVYESLGDVALAESDFPLAHYYYRKPLEFFYGVGFSWMYAFHIIYIAQAYAAENQPEQAVTTLATIYPHLTAYLDKDQDAYALRDQLESQLEPDRFAAAWQRGKNRTLNVLVRKLLAELEDDFS